MLAVLSITVARTAAADAAIDDGWIATWTTAMLKPTFVFNNAGNYGFDDQTLRQTIFTSAGGDAVRVRLTNRFGQRPLLIGRASIGYRGKPFNADLIPAMTRPLTFAGQASAAIPAGEELLSDPVELNVLAHQVLAIDIYLPERTGPIGYNFLTNTTSYLAVGDQAGSPDGSRFDASDSWYVVKDVEVRNSRARGVIVACCDSVSITGQRNANMRWPEVLSRRLQRELGSEAPSVIQTTLSGQRLLTSSNYAESVLARFERDVLAITGVTKVILFVGVNDLGFAQMPDIDQFRPVTDVSAEQMIHGFEEVAAMAKRQGVDIYGATITPGSGYAHRGSPYWSPAQEVKRNRINQWLRSTQVFDGVFDFAAAVQNPFDSQYYAPWASLDNIHPADGGQYAIAYSIDLTELIGR